jgi:endonuclease/exonuclease/phosphatase family metal-dependent hydrolase
MATIRLVSYNTLFGGRDSEGLGDDARWKAAAAFLRSLEGDLYALQECNFWELLGNRRLHQARADLGMSSAFLAQANTTTAGHRFHSALLLGPRWQVSAEGAERNRYHHVLGWATARLDGHPNPWSIRNIHFDPFSPTNRAKETEPLLTLAAPGRLSLLLGDANTLGIGHPEPNWSPLPPHLHRTQLLQDEHGMLNADRTAMSALEAAGFVDAAHRQGDDRPTGGFSTGDVERRQDLFLLSPTLAEAIVSYDVHTAPIDHEWSDHCAISLALDYDRLLQGSQ